MEPFVGPAAPFVPEGDGYDDVDLLSPSREQQAKKKPAVVRKHNEAIQSQLREGAFLGTLHLPVDYGGFQKTISETNFRIKERYNKNLKELTRIIADFDTEVERFNKEGADPKNPFKETADRYRLLQRGPNSCIKIDRKHEPRVLFPRFGKPRPRALADKKDASKDAEPPIRGVITQDRDEKDKVMWSYEGQWHTPEELRKIEKKDWPHDVWASMEDLQKGVVYEADRGWREREGEGGERGWGWAGEGPRGDWGSQSAPLCISAATASAPGLVPAARLAPRLLGTGPQWRPTGSAACSGARLHARAGFSKHSFRPRCARAARAQRPGDIRNPTFASLIGEWGVGMGWRGEEMVGGVGREGVHAGSGLRCGRC
jgi:hypothetical protein